MSVLNPQLQGRSAVGTCIVEAAGAFASLTAAHAATDSFKHISYSSTPNEDRQPRRDVRTARDDISVMIRNRTNEWSLTSYFLPRGGNTPPDIAPFWRAGFGSEAIGSGVTYGYARVPPSLAFIITGGEPTPVAQEKVVGALVNETIITLQPGEEPRVQFNGIASAIVRALGTTTIGAGANSATQNITAGQVARMKVGSIMEVVGIATGLRVVSRSLSGNTVTFDQSINTAAGGQIVRPYTPWSDATANQGGEPIAAWNGSITIGGSSAYSAGLAGATINIANNWTEKRTQFSQNFIDAGVGHRMVTGTLSFFARDVDLALLAQAEETPSSGYPGTLNPMGVVLTLGDSTNGQCVITMPNVVLNFAQLSIPEDGDATFEIPFLALSTFTSGVPNNNAIRARWS